MNELWAAKVAENVRDFTALAADNGFCFLIAIGRQAPANLGAFGASDENGIAPLIVGLLVFGIGLSLGGPTGYAINPARDLGPRIVHALLPIPGKGGSDWEYSWVPIVGPIIGGILGAFIWTIMPWG